MGIFATARALKALSNEMVELRADVHRLETANKRLGLEWEELYDKVRHQMSRMARRDAAARKAEGDPEQAHDDPYNSEATDPISAKILARRGIRRQAE